MLGAPVMTDRPDNSRLLRALDITWPPAGTVAESGWTLRRGGDGGKRVSAASLDGVQSDIAAAEARMRAWDQRPLFRLIPGEERLDAALEARGYVRLDPTVFYLAPVGLLDDGRDEVARVIRVSTPLAYLTEIWLRGGIGPGRRAVMARSPGPKIDLMARLGDRPAGAAFAAINRELAMIHAIEVAPGHRRGGAGETLIRGAASFAVEQGADWLALAVTEANAPARALYEKLGMSQAGRYHYRILAE